MKINFEDKNLIIRYLLKDLPDVEKSSFEEEYFENQEVFEYLLVVEDELIDEYVKGLLPIEIQEKFEKNFLTTTKRQQRVEFARMLIKKVEDEKFLNPKTLATVKSENFWQRFLNSFYSNAFVFRWSLTTAGIVLAVVTLWLYVKRVDTISKELEKKQISPTNLPVNKGLKDKELPPLKIEPNLEAKENPPKKIEKETFAQKKTAKTFPTIALVLTPPTRGSEDSNVLELDTSQEGKTVNIKLILDKGVDYKKYSVVLTKLDRRGNEEIWKKILSIGNRQENKFLLIQISTKLLESADYEFTISSLPDKDEYQQSYSFTVKK